ncbi:hypothetical protein LSUE1_G007519, partial [Lachnellula suecica]
MDLEWKEHRDDGETLLPSHEDGRVREDEEDEVQRKSVKGVLFVVLGTTATLAARRLLRGGFPFYFVSMLQITAYCLVGFVVLLVKLKNFRRPKLKVDETVEKFSILQKLAIGARLGVSSFLAAVAMLFGAKALVLYENLCILAMLPIFTYVCDSLILRLLHVFRLSRQEKVDILWGSFWKVVLVPLWLGIAVYEDYRLHTTALSYALASFVLMSVARSISKIGPRYDKGTTTWDTPLSVFLLIGIPFLVVTGFATYRYEDMVAASHVTQSWTFWTRLMNLAPGVCLHILFSSSMNSAYPFLSLDHAGGALEDPTPQGNEAVRSTLHTGFWVILFGVYGKEQNLIDWYQAIAFTLIYVVSVGPKHIGYYLPRLFNFVTRLFRRKPSPIHSEPWQFLAVLPITNLMFAILMSATSMYWINTVAYNRNLKTWVGPAQLTVDTLYRPPQMRSFDIIIAHSPGDPLESITNLISAYTSIPTVRGFAPRVIVYTKDQAHNATTPEAIRGPYTGEVSIQSLRNSGGVPATYLHHILYAWEFVSQQTLFLSTASNYPILESASRMNSYFQPAGFPLPDATPKTGFLHLGEQESCWCGSCADSTGWEDTFHLVPSMWSAARPGSPTCNSALVTRGNEFVASSARIRGVKRDVWQMLYDALTKEDWANSWAHDKKRMPVLLEGEKRMGKWAEDGVYGVPDSLEDPLFALTVERLWGILLQCSVPEIAWRCPNLSSGWRM